MKYRRLLTGKLVPELEKEVSIIISTKCPAKWVLVDLETGDQYGSTGTNTPVSDKKYLEQHFVKPLKRFKLPKRLF